MIASDRSANEQARPRVAVVMGTRPEVIKNAPIVAALARSKVAFDVLHTGQHTDYEMNGLIFEQMGYVPTEQLEPPYHVGRAIDWVIDRIKRRGLDLVLVNGDTAAALIGATAALYADTLLAHVEAGLRSFDPAMVEERNRVMVDGAAHLLFPYTRWEERFLERSEDRRGTIHTVGNPTVDVIERIGSNLPPPRDGRFAFATLHRKELTDSRERLLSVFEGLRRVAERCPVVFPIHPRTAVAMEQFGIRSEDALRGVDVVGPVGFLEALAHVQHAEVVLTDSGCVQEEACILNVPCVTVRENTERHGTIDIGANVLSGLDSSAILEAFERQRHTRGPFERIFGEPGVGERIVAVLLGELGVARPSSHSGVNHHSPPR